MGDHDDGLLGSSTERRRKPSTSPPERESRFPVGSSANTTYGRDAKARAHATRCCCPPDSSLGRCEQPITQSDRVDDFVDPLLVGFTPSNVHRQRDVLQRCQRGNQVVRLEHKAK